MRLVYLQPFVTSAQRILEEVVSEGIVTGDVRLAAQDRERHERRTDR